MEYHQIDHICSLLLKHSRNQGHLIRKLSRSQPPYQTQQVYRIDPLNPVVCGALQEEQQHQARRLHIHNWKQSSRVERRLFQTQRAVSRVRSEARTRPPPQGRNGLAWRTYSTQHGKIEDRFNVEYNGGRGAGKPFVFDALHWATDDQM